MKKEIFEYDGYKIPEALKKETPETKKKRAEAITELDKIIERQLREAKKAANE